MSDHAPRVAPVPRLSLSVEEAGQAVGLCGKTVSKLIAEGRLRAVRVGTRRLIAVTEIERWLTAEASVIPAATPIEPVATLATSGRAQS
jgi:excisionase family DNA binding protein